MRLLLDTRVFLWCVKDGKKLSRAVRSKISSVLEVYVSSASIWELVIKIKIGKLKAKTEHLVLAISESGFSELPIAVHHALPLIAFQIFIEILLIVC